MAEGLVLPELVKVAEQSAVQGEVAGRPAEGRTLRPRDHALFLLLLAFGIARTLRHAMWRDELQIFQLGTASRSIVELFHRLRYEAHAGQIDVSGEFPLKQSDLGLTPFSALLGALQVVDEMKVRFHLVAHTALVRP